MILSGSDWHEMIVVVSSGVGDTVSRRKLGKFVV